MQPKCFFIGTTLADNPVPKHFVALAMELAQRGHQVLLLAPHRKVELEDHGSNPSVYTWPSERPTRICDLRFLLRLLEQYRPACLIGNFAAVNLMMTAGWFKQVPRRVAWYHTISTQLEMDQPQPRWKLALQNQRKRLVYNCATQMVANSTASALDLQAVFHLPKARCQVFNNSLADPVKELHLKADPPIPGRIVCVGRLFPSKGQDVLLRALAIVRKKVPSAHLELVGVGPSRPHYEQLACSLGIQHKCVFAGQVAHHEVLQKMADAVVTVVPSRQEAFGLVNIESLAVGTPVIASAVGGIPEIIRDGLDGFLVPPDNPEALAAKLKLLLSDSHLRRAMRTGGRQRFLSEFEQRRVVRRQADWFEAITSSVHQEN